MSMVYPRSHSEQVVYWFPAEFSSKWQVLQFSSHFMVSSYLHVYVSLTYIQSSSQALHTGIFYPLTVFIPQFSHPSSTEEHCLHELYISS